MPAVYQSHRWNILVILMQRCISRAISIDSLPSFLSLSYWYNGMNARLWIALLREIRQLR